MSAVSLDTDRARSLARDLQAAGRSLHACGPRPGADVPAAVAGPLAALLDGADAVSTQLGDVAGGLAELLGDAVTTATQVDRW